MESLNARQLESQCPSYIRQLERQCPSYTRQLESQTLYLAAGEPDSLIIPATTPLNRGLKNPIFSIFEDFGPPGARTQRLKTSKILNC